MSDEISEQQAEELVRQYMQGDKQSLYNFLNNVVKTPDTTKVGNLTMDELGTSKLPVRTYQELALFCNDIAGMKQMSDFFTKMGEIQLATGLSKDGFLIRAAITTKKELADVTPQRKKNPGWFGVGGKKNSDNSQSGGAE